MDPTWKPIPDYPAYEASTNGDIRRNQHILKPFKTWHGYYQVTLSSEQRRKFYVHRLIAQTFLPNPERYTVVHHKDGIRTNNSVENLQWVDYRTNQEHAFAGDDGCRASRELSCAIRKLHKEGLTDREIAEQCGTGMHTVAMALIRFRWKHEHPQGTTVAEERWTTLSEFPLYEISTHGNVRRGNKILHPVVNRALGYPIVCLRRDNQSFRVYVHRLVVTTFIGPPPAHIVNPRVHHKDNNRTNNILENLEWVAHKENIKHRYHAKY